MNENSFIVVDNDTGQALRSGSLPPGILPGLQIMPGENCRLILGQGVVEDNTTCYFDASDMRVAIPPQPALGFVWDWPSHAWLDARTLDQQRAAQVVAINAAFASATAALTAGYPADERATWDMQRGEALAWQADPTVATPYLDSVAAARGIAAEEMRGKTLENVLLFTQASAALIGHRQALRDAIQQATTPEAVAAVVWTNPLTASATSATTATTGSTTP